MVGGDHTDDGDDDGGDDDDVRVKSSAAGPGSG